MAGSLRVVLSLALHGLGSDCCYVHSSGLVNPLLHRGRFVQALSCRGRNDQLRIAMSMLRGGGGEVDGNTDVRGPLRIMLVDKSAKAPCRATEGAVGYDVYSAAATVVKGRSSAVVGTGVAVAIPRGCYGRIAPRSGACNVEGSRDVKGVPSRVGGQELDRCRSGGHRPGLQGGSESLVVQPWR
mmetsp:Transcript_6840/g.24017  ORF Transcript_6840/g.24017 Transcript_6840/m.24017 type:complete len:184 (+) Transcript_6840:23-574(+)